MIRTVTVVMNYDVTGGFPRRSPEVLPHIGHFEDSFLEYNILHLLHTNIATNGTAIILLATIPV